MGHDESTCYWLTSVAALNTGSGMGLISLVAAGEFVENKEDTDTRFESLRSNEAISRRLGGLAGRLQQVEIPEYQKTDQDKMINMPLSLVLPLDISLPCTKSNDNMEETIPCELSSAGVPSLKSLKSQTQLAMSRFRSSGSSFPMPCFHVEDHSVPRSEDVFQFSQNLTTAENKLLLTEFGGKALAEAQWVSPAGSPICYGTDD